MLNSQSSFSLRPRTQPPALWLPGQLHYYLFFFGALMLFLISLPFLSASPLSN